VDCERIVSLLGPLVRYQSPALRLLHASTFLMRHYERFCYVCGRVHDLPAEVETQVGPPASIMTMTDQLRKTSYYTMYG
jgi:hypothetical protein